MTSDYGELAMLMEVPFGSSINYSDCLDLSARF